MSNGRSFRHSIVKSLRAKYPKGTRIELIKMADQFTKLTLGDRGTVSWIDDIGQIHVDWDCGSTLALIPEVDDFKIIEGGGNDGT